MLSRPVAVIMDSNLVRFTAGVVEWAQARRLGDAVQKKGKPIVPNFMAGELVTEGVAYPKEHGIAKYPISEGAVTVVARMADLGGRKVSTQVVPELAPS